MYIIDYDKMRPAEGKAKAANKYSNVGYAIPDTIAMNMVELIDSSWFIPKSSELNGNKLLLDEYANNHRVLDICCNSGILLYWFLQRFRTYLERYAKTSFNNSEDELCEYIIKNLLYGVSINLTICQIIRSMLYNNRDVYGNIYNCDVLNATHHADSDEFEVRGSEVYIYDRSKGEKVPMKFDVVCGNPPYNDGLHFKFIKKSFEIAANYVLLITPDAWRFNEQGKVVKYVQDIIVPHIKELFLDDSKNIFGDSISPFTVSYFLIDKKNIYADKKVNGSLFRNYNRLQNPDGLYHGITDKIRLSSSFKSIASYTSIFQPRNFCRTSIPDFGEKNFNEAVIDINSPIIMTATNNVYHVNKSCIKTDMLDTVDKFSLYTTAWVQQTFVGHINEPYNIEYGKNLTLYLGTKSECESALQYYSSKLIWFLVYANFGVRAIHTRCFTFVPDPGSFDKVYEDRPLEGYTPDENGVYTDSNGVVHCSLYVRYKLTEEEINIIESVIRERS